MADVLFYHLEMQPLERVLPVLLEKTIERGWRAVVQCVSDERAAALDALLWTFRDDSFLAHGKAGDGGEAEQPILIVTDDTNANAATVRFFVDRAVPRAADDYERLVFLFSGHDSDAVTDARAAWRALGPGNVLTYWQQDESGRWAKKAGA
ncbi:MAG: polymerase chi subunit [Devosia sp.]|nr:polymerase chi subunit [Devosia sp.]